jgi:hypothetical protein
LLGFLDIHGKAAVDGKMRNTGMFADDVKLVHILQGQLPGGDQDEGLDAGDLGINHFGKRDAAGAGLAGACFGYGHEIPSLADQGIGLLLDGCQVGIAHPGHGLHYFGTEPEFVKFHLCNYILILFIERQNFHHHK